MPPLGRGDGLLVVDVQRDFCAGGALPVPGGDEVVTILNGWMARARAAGVPVYLTRDWHPEHHVSFRERGGKWPAHCVQGTPGAEFHPKLAPPPNAVIIDKGSDLDRDAYSAFSGTGLEERLRSDAVGRLWVGGLALDYCVRSSVLDALDLGFEVHLLRDATRAVNVKPDDGELALAEVRGAGAVIEGARHPSDDPALITDFYELTMLQAYFDEHLTAPAVFDLYVRALPAHRNALVAAGLDDALTYLEELAFSPEAIGYLESLGRFSPEFLNWLSGFRFTGDVRAVPEGTLVFPGEPLLEIEAPLPQAQLLETLLLNQVHVETLIASKAIRVVTAAEGRTVADFGLRRMHGTDAGLKGSRACWIAGVSATSNLLAGRLYGIPITGTMAHSYVQAHGDDAKAFEAWAAQFPEATVVVDTYDTLEGVRAVIAMPRAPDGSPRLRAIRLDSGDLGRLSVEARRLLDEAGLQRVAIFASGGLDEWCIRDLVRAGAPIDGFGVGARMGTSDDAPSLDMVFKLCSYAGEGNIKVSEGKETLPGAKQVWRVEEEGEAVRDVISLRDEAAPGRPLLVQVMRAGRRLPGATGTLRDARIRARSQWAELPPRVRGIDPAEPPYPVELSPGLSAEVERLRARAAHRRAEVPPAPAAREPK